MVFWITAITDIALFQNSHSCTIHTRPSFPLPPSLSSCLPLSLPPLGMMIEEPFQRALKLEVFANTIRRDLSDLLHVCDVSPVPLNITSEALGTFFFSPLRWRKNLFPWFFSKYTLKLILSCVWQFLLLTLSVTPIHLLLIRVRSSIFLSFGCCEQAAWREGADTCWSILRDSSTAREGLLSPAWKWPLRDVHPQLESQWFKYWYRWSWICGWSGYQFKCCERATMNTKRCPNRYSDDNYRTTTLRQIKWTDQHRSCGPHFWQPASSLL